MEEDLLVQGRRLGWEELSWLAQWIEDHPQWSRKRLARELCERWCWRDGSGVPFGAPAWRRAHGDEFLGCGDTQRREQLHRLANNTRFLILPWVRVSHLASHVLGAVARRISADWQSKYGHGLDWLET